MSEDDSDMVDSDHLEQPLTTTVPGVGALLSEAVSGVGVQGDRDMDGLGSSSNLCSSANDRAPVPPESEVMSPTMGMPQDMLLRVCKQMQDLQSENKLLRGQIEGWETPRASPMPKPSDGNAESSNIESKVAGNAGLNTEK